MESGLPEPQAPVINLLMGMTIAHQPKGWSHHASIHCTTRPYRNYSPMRQPTALIGKPTPNITSYAGMSQRQCRWWPSILLKDVQSSKHGSTSSFELGATSIMTAYLRTKIWDRIATYLTRNLLDLDTILNNTLPKDCVQTFL